VRRFAQNALLLRIVQLLSEYFHGDPHSGMQLVGGESGELLLKATSPLALMPAGGRG
jgi:hypothetical protein